MSVLISLFAFSGFGRITPNYLTGKYDPMTMGTGYAIAIFIRNAINAFYIVAGLAVFIYLLMGGLKYITAGGDQKATQEANKQITGAIIGMAIIIGSYAFVTVVGKILGIDIFYPVFRSP